MTDHPYAYAAQRILRAFAKQESAREPFSAEVQKLWAKSAKADTKLQSCITLYDGLSALTGSELPWGIFTGVRPIRYLRENRGQIADFRISAEKLALADEIIAAQADTLALPRTLCYVGIPFCPSRCSYCSFVSESVAKSAKLIPQYIDLLLRELQLLQRRCTSAFDSIYIGGGTPTSLPLPQLERLFAAIDVSGAQEFTVEAGRPETLSAEVTAAIANAGATRISINPQSMNDETLRIIGRGHNSSDIYKACENARKYDFIINMDLIGGLPGESCSDFADSLNKVVALSPENITIHSLARKRAAGMGATADFTEIAREILKSAGYSPYYLYRQSDSSGDNIGYAKTRAAVRSRNAVCVYNVCNMDESAAVFAAGCGGASRFFENGKTRKHYNFKYPYEYISRFKEVLAK
jgi:oxygen-independent coproporphyrinogen-3 oxidase